MLRKLSDIGTHEVLTSVWIAFIGRTLNPEGTSMNEIVMKENILDRTKVHFEKMDD